MEKSSHNLRKMQQYADKTNTSRQLTAEENKRLHKLEAIPDKLKREENVQSSGEVTH